ncbi:MAG: serine hydrolase [Planctomycetes bacterium]|nr:serine hydrolase [Planctomycetota bacterium]
MSRTTGTSALDLARRALFEPLGIRDALWPADPQGVTCGWGELRLHPLDMAKIGLLWLQRGAWEGKQLVSEAWLDRAMRTHAATGGDSAYGYGFWVGHRDWPGLCEAVGRGGQRISVLPEKDLVVVFTGGGFDPGEIGRLLARAVRSDGPLPESPAARARLEAALEEIRRPPAPRPVPALPALVADVSGRTYRLEPNPYGLEDVALRFDAGGEAWLRLGLAGQPRDWRPVGLDGVPRASPGGRYGLPVGLRGEWKTGTGDVFALEYGEIGNINCFQVELAFEGDEVAVGIIERTGLPGAELRGRAQPP